MRLAVVIPVYNHGRYIAAGLESVLSQTRPPDRVIVIDDGSKDDSLAVCQAFQSRGVEVIGRENRGAHATINELIGMASQDCELISILNSDDQYAPQRFEKCLPVFESDPAAAVVTTGLVQMDDDDRPLPPDHPRGQWLRAVWSRWGEPDLDLAEWMGQANFVVTTSNVIARREFLHTHPFKPYRFNHDSYFLSQAALRGRLRVVDGPHILYRVHATNTINTAPAPLLRELLNQWLDLYHDLAPELAEDVALRQRFYRFSRASWDNVSAHHHGLLQVLLARLIAGHSPETLAETVQALSEAAWPELTTYPNKELVNRYDGTAPFGAASASLTDKVGTLRSERDAARAEAAAAKDLAKLRQRLLGSKRAALGRFLGLAKGLDIDSGKTAVEKLANLRRAVAACRWARGIE